MTTTNEHIQQGQWASIKDSTHSDAYSESIEGQNRFTTIDDSGKRVPIEVNNQCVFGCGHCGIVFKTLEDLERVMCVTQQP